MTEEGCEVISDVPRTVSEIEAYMKNPPPSDIPFLDAIQEQATPNAIHDQVVATVVQAGDVVTKTENLAIYDFGQSGFLAG